MKQKQKECLWQNDVFLGFELTEDEHGNKQCEIIFSVVLVTLMFKHVKGMSEGHGLRFHASAVKGHFQPDGFAGSRAYSFSLFGVFFYAPLPFCLDYYLHWSLL
jgi:hypothetical protein